MWLLALILSIKLQMPTWYWIIFTIYTVLIMPTLAFIKYCILVEVYKTAKKNDK